MKKGYLYDKTERAKNIHREEFIREMVMNVARSDKSNPYGPWDSTVKWINNLYDEIYVKE